MADKKKISELSPLSQLSDSDEFVVVDKSKVSGPDASNSGRTSKVLFKDLKTMISDDPRAKGPSGPAGQQGEVGSVGPAGPTGPVGPEGPKGDVGPLGPRGEQGTIGPKGDAGPVGPIGPKGEQGIQGPAGTAAQRGEPGTPGEKGEPGDQGVQGPEGARGSQGIQGATGKQGEKGEQGERGIEGPRGEKGLQGDQGVQGERGEQGVPGAAASKGDPGERGEQGERGERGLPGETGNPGVPGSPGAPGAPGATGAEGPRGPAPGHAWSGTKLRFMQSSGHWGGWSELRGPAGPAGKDATTGSSPKFTGTVSALNGYGFTVKSNQQHTGFSWASTSNVSTCKGLALVNSGKSSQYMRICGNPMGTEHLYGSEAARVYKNNTIHVYKNLTVGPSPTSKQTTHIGQGGHITIGSPDNLNEGGQLNIRNPQKSPNPSGYVVVDNFYDSGTHYKNYHNSSAKAYYFRVNYNTGTGVGHNLFGLSSDWGHHLNGHLNLYDGNNAAVIHQGNPSNQMRQNFLIRWSPSLGRYQDNLALHSGTGNFSVRGTIWGTRWVGGSDRNKKKDIEKLNSVESMDSIMQLNPVKFNWKDPSKASQHKQMGLIAQEAELIVPSIVDELEDMHTEHDANCPSQSPQKCDESECPPKKTTKTIAYMELVPLLISGLQEQQKQIDELRKQIATK